MLKDSVIEEQVCSMLFMDDFDDISEIAKQLVRRAKGLIEVDVADNELCVIGSGVKKEGCAKCPLTITCGKKAVIPGVVMLTKALRLPSIEVLEEACQRVKRILSAETIEELTAPFLELTEEAGKNQSLPESLKREIAALGNSLDY